MDHLNSKRNDSRQDDPGSSNDSQSSFPSAESVLDNACQDLMRRFRDGKPYQVEEYLKKHPQLNEPRAILELLDAEVCCRFDSGTLSVDELVSRFPKFEADIIRMAQLCGLEFQMDRSSTPVAESVSAFPTPPSHFQIIGRLPWSESFRAKRIPVSTGFESSEVVSQNWNDSTKATLCLHFNRDSELNSEVWAHQWTHFRHPSWLPVFEMGVQPNAIYCASQYCEANSLSKTLNGYARLNRRAWEDKSQSLLMKVSYALLAAIESQLNLAYFRPMNVQLEHTGKVRISAATLAMATASSQAKVGRSEAELGRSLVNSVKILIELVDPSDQSEAFNFWRQSINRLSNEPNIGIIQNWIDELQHFVSKRCKT